MLTLARLISAVVKIIFINHPLVFVDKGVYKFLRIVYRQGCPVEDVAIWLLSFPFTFACTMCAGT